ncbi:endonuclease/exonuclease/phosphatase family protein [Flavobacterium rhizosphaerae]|uniref:Endonuclease/exonuclease/phosphatase family protein n=1 Tax=Flavobacterium rhizosphaerae TaxID=3163298 RepID=A0ABW8YY50_9FLAO
MIKHLRVIFLFIITLQFAHAQGGRQFKVHTVSFYNLENLFDTTDDPKINDDDFLPNGSYHWTTENYKKKLSNLSRVIAEIGSTDNPNNAPVVIGVSEVENRGVLEDLIKQPALAKYDYGIVHFDSPDKRGIDVALLYQKKYFIPVSYKNIPLYIYRDGNVGKKEDYKEDDDNTETGRVYTRDQLLVTGMLDGEQISFIVNHWPSRSGGEKRSSPFREAAAALNRKIVDSLYKNNPDAKIITMGDLNDGPYNKSVKKVLGAKATPEETKKGGLYNPMEEMSNKGIGTLAYRDAWDLFDQMIISEPLLKKDYSSFRYWKAGVYNKAFMTQQDGRYKGYPLRNSNGEAGFSDHFPVYLYLIKEL